MSEADRPPDDAGARAARRRPPAQPSPLIGRGRELATATDRLRDPAVRLLTLTGAPGSGKTRLALAVAEALAPLFEHGIVVVSLDDVDAPELVPAAVARALGLAESGSRTVEQQVLAALRTSHRLLLLDTLEHLLSAAPWLAALLGECPEIKLLVTSRAALRIRWESEMPVPPLAVEAIQPPTDDSRQPARRERPATGARSADAPAVELFVRRAAAVAPGFALTDENRAAVVALCRRLDGLPLAIELAAARCVLLSPAAILARLEEGLTLLAGGSRDLPERQWALGAAIDWSHALLPPAEQRLFRRLAVFAGGCAPEALETMAAEAGDVGPEPLEHVAALRRHNLLVAEVGETGTRLRLLETVRAFALEQLGASGDERPVRDWHARYYLTLVRDADARLTGPDQVAALALLDGEQDNIRAALEWALRSGDAETVLMLCNAAWRFWRLRGRLSEGRRLLERSLACGTAPAPLRADALLGLGALATAQGDPDAARPALEEAFALRQEFDDRAGLAATLQELGNLALRRGDYAGARLLYGQSLALARAAGDRWGVAVTLNNVGLTLRRLGDAGAARALFAEGLTLARSLGDRRTTALSLTNLGNAARDDGDYALARSLHEESLALWRELGHRAATAASLSHLAATARRQGDGAAAYRASADSLAIVRDLGDMTGVAVSLAALAASAGAGDRREQAARLFGAAETLLRSAGASALLTGADEFRDAIAAGRAALGAAWDAAWRAGAILSPEQAIGEALAVAEQGAAGHPASATPQPLAVALSRREREVLRLLADGRTNREIAGELVLSIRTVESHVFNTYAKIGARGRAEATAYAVRHGLA